MPLQRVSAISDSRTCIRVPRRSTSSRRDASLSVCALGDMPSGLSRDAAFAFLRPCGTEVALALLSVHPLEAPAISATEVVRACSQLKAGAASLPALGLVWSVTFAPDVVLDRHTEAACQGAAHEDAVTQVIMTLVARVEEPPGHVAGMLSRSSVAATPQLMRLRVGSQVAIEERCASPASASSRVRDPC